MTSAYVSTSSTNQGPVDSLSAMVSPPARKRRRRTGTGGAADDCFACRNRAVKCDRKRPYCTQCLEIGKECSGYKTTLTWGVGVASRGHLRGLSCPIANKNADGTDVTPAEMEARRRKSSTVKTKREEVSKTVTPPATSTASTNPSEPDLLPTHSLGYTYPPNSAPTAVSQTQAGWQTSGFQAHVQSRAAHGGRTLPLNYRTIEYLQTALEAHYDNATIPHTGRSISSHTDSDFYSPLDYARTPASMPYTEPLPLPTSNPILHHQYPAQSMATFGTISVPTNHYVDTMNSEIKAAPSYGNYQSGGPVNASILELDSFSNGFYDQSGAVVSSAPLQHMTFPGATSSGPDLQLDDIDEEGGSLSSVDLRFGNTFFHITPRLQSLMEYYSRNICPYLVAFDGPENPYRHVLQLAMNNEGLQNAIAALSTNNLRMRRKDSQYGGFRQGIASAFDEPSSDFNEASPEESCYKQVSIDQLNMQLTDVRAAQDDSVFATLLILCLFHVCDSGFSKFKTQLSGVQKLLSLRNPNSQSTFTRWVEMFFTWFDVMTSTVNDREMQIKGDSMSLLDFSSDLGAMEQFSGCDGRLFKLIARLGRLNLLAQGRPVRRGSNETQSQRGPVYEPSFRHMWRKKYGSQYRANRSLSPADYENIDGNGWGTPILSSDDDADGSADEGFRASDGRQEFWMEWQDLRSRLQSWQMDLSSPPASASSSDPAEIEAGQRDLRHINESFRCSALLYTERLGQPLLPSSHAQFQRLVHKALYHITAIPATSCVNKFLLWPLFIIGTECVDEGHRDIIRACCRNVMEESGFYNNLSSLSVLEKVWSESGTHAPADEMKARRRDSEASRSGRYGQAFRWRKAMDRVDGEYIVI